MASTAAERIATDRAKREADDDRARRELKMWFARELRERRRHAAISQDDLADAIGVTRQTYNYWEQPGHSAMPRDMLHWFKLCEILGWDHPFAGTPQGRRIAASIRWFLRTPPEQAQRRRSA